MIIYFNNNNNNNNNNDRKNSNNNNNDTNIYFNHLNKYNKWHYTFIAGTGTAS